MSRDDFILVALRCGLAADINCLEEVIAAKHRSLFGAELNI